MRTYVVCQHGNWGWKDACKLYASVCAPASFQIRFGQLATAPGWLFPRFRMQYSLFRFSSLICRSMHMCACRLVSRIYLLLYSFILGLRLFGLTGLTCNKLSWRSVVSACSGHMLLHFLSASQDFRVPESVGRTAQPLFVHLHVNLHVNLYLRILPGSKRVCGRSS
jgi:hypothetical protein